MKRKLTPVKVKMFHITGTPKSHLDTSFHLYPPESKTCVIARQRDGSYLVYGHTKKILNQHFSEWKLLEEKYWNPAFAKVQGGLVEAEIRKNLFLAGDYNLIGIEDAFLTGLYAANQIITREI